MTLTQAALSSGSLPLGATATADGCFFCVYAPYADEIRVHIFDADDRELQAVTLENSKNGFRSGLVRGVGIGAFYAYEAIGIEDPSAGIYSKAGRYLVDPYAKVISRPFVFSEKSYETDSAAFLPKAVVCAAADSFDWEGVEKPEEARTDLVNYELNVRAYTLQCEEIPKAIRGTYLALSHHKVIAHLKKLGVNAVELLPVAASMTEPEVTQKGLVNLWGYNPVCFMAPDPRYACNPLLIRDEFRTMVRELHRHGIAVILDVVFNHTAEGGAKGPVLSLKGLANRDYYAFAGHKNRERGKYEFNYREYLNVTGCGNSVCVDNRVTLGLVLDSLRYWSDFMQVDGFRFDLAVTNCRESRGHVHFGFEQAYNPCIPLTNI